MSEHVAPTKRHQRLRPEERRRQLIAIAGELLSRHGVDGLQFTDLATAAHVTRPVIYKFFATRNALIDAVLADFEEELMRRLREAATASTRANVEDASRAVVDAICDTIETKGSGAWRLLDGHGPDLAIARLGRKHQERLIRPWQPAIASMTGASPREVGTLSAMLVATGRAVFERWYTGAITRAEAARDATRGVSALLQAFMDNEKPR